jgi:DNA-binding transcriptional MerR regulator
MLSYNLLKILKCDIEYEERDFPEQLFYSITQVSKIIDVPAHVIRYWEKHFNNLRPGRGASSNWRNYVSEDIVALREIKSLIESGMTINGAKKMLGKPRKEEAAISLLEDLLVEMEGV